MLSTKTVLEVKIGERTYTLELDPKSPLGEAYDAISQMRSFVIEKIVEENNKSKAKEKESTSSE